MKKMMVLILALCMMMTAAGSMAETKFMAKVANSTGDPDISITAESIIANEITDVGEAAGFGAVAVSKAMYDKIKGDDQDKWTDYSKKYFALTLPDGKNSGNYIVRIPHSYFPGIQKYDVESKVFVGYAQRGDGNVWTGTVLDRTNSAIFEKYIISDTEWELGVAIPMTPGKPTVLGITYKSAGDNGGGNDGGGVPGNKAPAGSAAAADMPQTGDPSSLMAWVCLLGASAAAMKARSKK